MVGNCNSLEGLTKQTRTVSEAAEMFSSDVIRQLRAEVSSLKEELAVAREKESEVRELTKEKGNLLSKVHAAENQTEVISVRFNLMTERTQEKLAVLPTQLVSF